MEREEIAEALAAREAAAERMARAAAPPGGRFEGLATKVPEAIVQGMGELAAFPGRYAQGQTGYQPGQMASEQPRATQWAPDMAFNMIGSPAAVGGLPGAGSGIRAWHASPHDFDKVDLSKIGTGQGAQSYGPGFYAAESPAVSGQGGEYWKEFMRHPKFDPVDREAAQYFDMAGFDRARAAQDVRDQMLKNAEYNKTMQYSEAQKAANAQHEQHLERILKRLESGEQVGPRVYELNIKADPRSFLQWDEPLKNQMQHVEKVPHLLDLAKEEAHSRVLSSSNQSRRNQLYDMISRPTEATGEFAFRSGAPDKTMGMLRDAGIPGVRYADAASRGPGVAKSTLDAHRMARLRLAGAEGAGDVPQWKLDHYREQVAETAARIERAKAAFPRTYNYVINNPDIIEIMRKLAIPGMVGAGMMGELARQDRREQ